MSWRQALLLVSVLAAVVAPVFLVEQSRIKPYTDVLTSLAWPLVVVAVGILFKNEIGALFRRLERIRHKETELVLGLQQKEQERTQLPSKDEIRIPPWVDEEFFRKAKKTLKEHLAGDEDELDKVYTFAISSFYKSLFERPYLTIYESQLRILRELKSRGQSPKESFSPICKELREKYPEVMGIETDNIVFFLKQNGFITDKDGGLSITELGDAFLKYVDSQPLIKRAF